MDSSDVLIYDTILRDGTQGEQINFSAVEKLRIAQRLDELGFHYIEGGLPGSNQKDMRFFEMAKGVSFKHARLTAFGSTRKPYMRAATCPNIMALLEAEKPSVAIFGKSCDLHLSDILNVSLDENLEMIGDSIEFLKSKGKGVIFDAEHFFDGYKNNPACARQVIESALSARG
jgi:2-isopropylmalate synthase